MPKFRRGAVAPPPESRVTCRLADERNGRCFAGALTPGERAGPMKRTSLLALVTTVVSLAVAGCAGEFNRAESGTVIGAVAGGILGNQVGKGTGRTVATVAGALVGGIVGHEIGRSMDAQDRRLAQDAELRALEDGPSGRPIAWRNPDSGHYGEVVPRRAYERADRTCRDYEHTVWIDEQREVVRGTACRQPDGTWRTIS